ncbi:MAG: HD-GYP domain-containing protein [Treponema sp.]|jgi:HD-GYP domain-containing protein (c-di-GMP phosphodiesterase class II)|nr:HD-GYP domain-containing protein [Treponema sp.]
MNTVFTNTLKPGMIFSAPVYMEAGNMLVAAQIPLRQKEMDLLFNLRIETVTTEGAIVNSGTEIAGIDEITEIAEIPDVDVNDIFNNFIDDFAEEEELAVAVEEFPPLKMGAVKFSISEVQQNTPSYRAYRNLIDKLDSVFTNMSKGVDIEMRYIDNIGTQLLQELHDHKDSFIDFILGGEISGQELAKSSVNTAILSALTAQEFRLPNHKILHIVAGALVHDIGMLRLSRGIRDKKGGLSPAELEQIKSHPLHSSKIVTKELFGPHEVNLIALQHHERWDGKGYPDHIAGPAIDMGARIVSVADAFEAMVSKKSFRSSMGGYEAVKNLLADNSRRFDPAVLLIFTKIMGIYPIGSIVRLNDNSVARVVKINSDAPIRPTIQMIIDAAGKVLKPGEGQTLDLLTVKGLFIKTAIDPAEFAEKK